MRHERLFSVHFGYCLQAATCDQFRCLPPYIKWRYLASLSQQRKSRSKKSSSLKLLWIMNRYLKLVSMFDIVGRLPSLQAICSVCQNTLLRRKWIVALLYCVKRGVLQNVKTHHDDVIKWKHFPRYSAFVRRIHRSPVNSPHKGQWHGALMFSLIFTRINGWVNKREAGDLRHYRAHHDVTVIFFPVYLSTGNKSVDQ